MATGNENRDTPLNLVIGDGPGGDRFPDRTRTDREIQLNTQYTEASNSAELSGNTATVPLAYKSAIPFNASLYPSPMRKMFIKKEKVAATATETIPQNVGNTCATYQHTQITDHSILNVPTVTPGRYNQDINILNVPPMPSFQHSHFGAVKPLPHLNFEIKMKAFKNANSGAVSSELVAKSKQIDKVIQKLKQKDHLKPGVKTPVTPVKQEVKPINVCDVDINVGTNRSGVSGCPNTSPVSPKNKQIDSVIQKLKELKEKAESTCTTQEPIAKPGKRKIEKVTCTKCDCSPEPKKKKVSDPRNSLFTNNDQTVKKKLKLDTENVHVKKKQCKKENKVAHCKKEDDVVRVDGKEKASMSKNMKSPKSIENNDSIHKKSVSAKAEESETEQKSLPTKENSVSSESKESLKSCKMNVDVSNKRVAKKKTKNNDSHGKISKTLTKAKQCLESKESKDKDNIKRMKDSPQKSCESLHESKNSDESEMLEPGIRRKRKADSAKARVEESLLKIIKENEDYSSKYKIPIAYRRVQRQASLNASALVNILYEKQVPVPKHKEAKDNSKRSKSESDLLQISKSLPTLSHSFTESPAKEPESKADCDGNISDKKSNVVVSKISSKTLSTSDDNKKPAQSADIQAKRNVKSAKENVEKKTKVKTAKQEKGSPLAKQTIKDTKDTKSTSSKKAKSVKNKSPEKIVDKKIRANLARINKANEIVKTDTSEKANEENIYVDESSDEEMTESDGDLFIVENPVKTVKKKETFHAARTHVIVNRKQMFGEKLNWCDCCHMYYSDPGRTYWTNQELVDQGQKHSQSQPIQSSSTDLSSTSMEVRPYTTQTHGTVVEASPYVNPVMSHGHVPSCSSCGCALPGTRCRHYTLGGVSSVPNLQVLSCHQGYNSAYPMQYSHPGSYSHCGNCCSNGPYHANGAPVLRQPQMAMTADPSILLRHPVPLQISHDPAHPISLQMSHGDAARQIPVQLQHGGDTSMHCVHHMSHHCCTSPGEITNISIGRNITLDSLDHTVVDIDVCGSGVDDIVDSKSQIQILDNTCEDNAFTAGNLANTPISISGGTSSFSTAANNHGPSEGPVLFAVPNTNDVPYTNLKPPTEDNSAINKNRNRRKMSQSELQSKMLKNKKTDESCNAKSQEFEGHPTDLHIKDCSDLKTHIPSDSTKTDIKERNQRKKSQTDGTSDVRDSVSVLNVGKVDEVKNTVDKEKKAKKSVAFHGWSWEGQPEIRTMTQVFDGRSVKRKCYPAIRHEDSDIIQVKDCVLVCSGPRQVDIPYVAKVTCFWECPETLEMMMTVLWYYRPEHTEGGRQPFHKDCELFAAKHRDESLVACIDDKGYVLTQNEYCRFRAESARLKYNQPPREKIVPDLEDQYPRRRIPQPDVDPENVFICRHVYDFKLKRVLKNPS